MSARHTAMLEKLRFSELHILAYIPTPKINLWLVLVFAIWMDTSIYTTKVLNELWKELQLVMKELYVDPAKARLVNYLHRFLIEGIPTW